MKNKATEAISESEESEDEQEKPQTSSVNNLSSSKYDLSNSDLSSESEEEERPPQKSPKQSRKSVESPKKNVYLNPLEKFISENSDLAKVTMNNVITEDDDVCLLEVPKAIDPALFIRKKINFDARTKLKLGGTKYVAEPTTEEIKAITFLGQKLQILHPIALLKMRKYTKQKQASDLVQTETVPPALPENLKVRHPLFGSEYKPKIVLSEEIEKKLNCVIEQELKKIKKKKKKKDQESDKMKEKPIIEPESIFASQDIDLDESISAILGTAKENDGEKQRKRKKSKNLENSVDENRMSKNSLREEMESTDTEHKKKRKKSGMQESPSQSFSDSTRLGEKNQQRSELSQLSDLILETSGSKKKKKKQSEDQAENSQSESMSESFTEKKKKKKNNSFTQETLSLPAYDSPVMQEKKPKPNNVKQEMNKSVHYETDEIEDDSEEERRQFLISMKREIKEPPRAVHYDTDEVEEESEEEIKTKKPTVKIPRDVHYDTDEVEEEFEEDRKTKKSTVKIPRGVHYDTDEVEEEFEEEKQIKSKKPSIKQEKIKQESSTKREVQQNSFINSTALPGLNLPLFEFDASGIMNRSAQEETPESEESGHKPKKKKKDKSVEGGDDSISKKQKKQKDDSQDYEQPTETNVKKRKIKQEVFSQDEEEQEGPSPKKKRNKVKKEPQEDLFKNSLISDLLSKVKSEMDTSINFKKRKSQ